MWSELQKNAFKLIKKALISSPVLSHINITAPLRIECDASKFAIGAVLSQEGHPICYQSRKLSSAEANYPVHERELLALVDALRKWRHLVHGSKIRAYTDHKSIIHLLSQKHLSGRQARWIQELAEYDVHIEYRKGCLNLAADALSRRPDHEIHNLSIISADEKFHDMIVESYSQDKFFSELYKFLKHPTPLLDVKDKSILSTNTWYSLDNELLYYTRDSRFKRLCLPRKDEIFKKVFYEFHDAPGSGHRGCTRLYLRMREFFFWPGMSKDILKYVSGCHSCQINSASNRQTAGILKPLDIPHSPFESVSMDFIINLPKTKSGNTGIYVIVDRLTKLVSFQPMPPKFDAPFTAKVYFDVIVRRFGLPKTIISDRDTRFMSLFWNKLFQFFETKLKPSSAFHPQTDGQTEVMNKTLENMLRHYSTLHYEYFVQSLLL
jgi:hypothetical protein